MSKKCCGIIYNENEKFCTMCGKSLKDLPNYDESPDKEKTQVAAEAPVATEASEEAAKTEQPVTLDMAEVEKIAASVKDAGKDENTDIAAGTEGEIAIAKSNNIEEKSDKAETQTEEPATATADDAAIEKATKENDEEDEDEDDEDEDDGTASAGLRFFGTLIILLMLASIVAVGLGVYFIKLKPFYRNHDINNPVIYEEMATDTDVTNIETRPALSQVSIEPATETDATLDDTATETDATATDATDTDASEDME